MLLPLSLAPLRLFSKKWVLRRTCASSRSIRSPNLDLCDLPHIRTGEDLRLLRDAQSKGGVHENEYRAGRLRIRSALAGAMRLVGVRNKSIAEALMSLTAEQRRALAVLA